MTETKPKLPAFPPSLALQALRATNYKNSACALAEIVDNAYDAGAKNIHIAIITEEGNEGGMPYHIAVLDDGKGMTPDALQKALQYGYGENLNQNSPEKIGRFGVGLLAATFNQCNALQVWSWQDGWDENKTKEAHSGQIKIDEDGGDSDDDATIEYPSKKPFPGYFDKVFSSFPGIHKNQVKSGTLVVWKNFHKFSWKRPKTFVDNLALECGRIYRNFIATGERRIVVSAWQISSPENESDIQLSNEVNNERIVGVVDPMFIAKWHHEALDVFNRKNISMFEPYARDGDSRMGEDGVLAPEEHSVFDEENRKIGSYRIFASHRRMGVVVEEAGVNRDPGGTKYGQLARQLEGVSILRAGRELDLDSKWLPRDQTTARWLGVSIDFDASLDDYLGVDNTKQSAPSLSRLAKYGKRDEEEIRKNADNRIVAEIAIRIHAIIYDMHQKVKKERKHSRSRRDDVSETAFSVPDADLGRFTDFSRWRHSEGNTADSDRNNPQDNREELDQAYDGTFVENEKGQNIPAKDVRPKIIFANDLKVDFVKEPDGGAIFKVRERQGIIIIALNESHPFFDHLHRVLNPESDEADEDDNNVSCEERLRDIKRIIQGLIYCYGRAECEAVGVKRREFEKVRLEWGCIAEQMMLEDDK